VEAAFQATGVSSNQGDALPAFLRLKRPLRALNALGAVVYLLLVMDFSPLEPAVGWLCLLAAVLEWQHHIAVRYPLIDDKKRTAWNRWYALNVGALALLWAAAGILLFPHGDFATQSLAGFALAVVATVTTLAHHERSRLSLLISIAILAPFSAQLIGQRNWHSAALSFFLIAILGVLRKLSVELATVRPAPAREGVNVEALRAELAKAEDDALDLRLELKTATENSAEFTSTIAHEIRTPLNGIIGIADILASKQLSGELGELTGTLKNSTDALLALVNDMLDFSKLEAGQIKIEPDWVNIRETLRLTMAPMRSRADLKKLTLDVDIAPGVPEKILSDAVRIRQIISNLVDNAIRFTDRGGIRVRASFLDSGNGTGEMEVAITDTGIGIPRDRQGELFQKFGQIRSSKSKNRAGTGLGLYLCKSFAALLDGAIEVESEEDKGATFRFRWRVDAERKSAAATMTEATVTEPGPPLEILVVDDNSANRMVATQFLKDLGYATDTAEDGLLAIEALRKKHYSLVFMDMLMPNLDGIEATRRIRSEIPRDRQPFIVGLTANTKKSEQEQSLAAGMDAFYTKPVRAEVFSDCIARMKKKAQVPRFKAEYLVDAAPPSANVVELRPDNMLSLNEGELLRLRALTQPGEKDFLDQLIDEFIAISERTREEIRQALNDKELVVAQRLAHKFQGGSRSVGAQKLVQITAQLEEHAESGTIEAAQADLKALEAELALVISILQQNWKLEPAPGRKAS